MSWIWLVLAVVSPLEEAQGQDVDQIEVQVLAFKQREIGAPFPNRFGRPASKGNRSAFTLHRSVPLGRANEKGRRVDPERLAFIRVVGA
ncbi:MAG: hypothetical protein AAGJ54_12940 [Planctomycetota bacterium]